jgi:uncharacterized protein YjbJ (UPF0337 family)
LVESRSTDREPNGPGGDVGSTEGRFDQGKGRLKEAAGDVTNNASLKREGKMDRAGGKVKEKAGKATDKVEGAVDRVKDKLTD